MCMVDFGESSEVYRRKTMRTRKERKCDECGRKIAIGETYSNAFMVYEGQGSTWVTCAHCLTAISWLVENCGGFMHGGVWEDLEEHIVEYRKLAFPLSRLKVGRERQWERFDRAGLMAVPPVPPSLETVGLAA